MDACPLPQPPGGTIIRGSIDLSAAGPRAALLPRDANNQFPTFRHFPIGEIIAALLSLSLSLRKFAYSRYSSSNISTNTSLSRVKNGEESGDESREGDERHLGGNWRFHFLSICIYERGPRKVENCRRDISIFCFPQGRHRLDRETEVVDLGRGEIFWLLEKRKEKRRGRKGKSRLWWRKEGGRDGSPPLLRTV